MCGVKQHQWHHKRPEVPKGLDGQLNQDTIYDITGALSVPFYTAHQPNILANI